jgi:uncharacterized protein (TIGR03437 family)
MRRFCSLVLACCWAVHAQVPLDRIALTALRMSSGEQPVFLMGTAGGLFRSTDERRTWTLVQLGTLNRRQPRITQVVFHPGSENTVYAAGPDEGRSVWRSSDAGLTWQQKTSGLPPDSQLVRLFVAVSAPGTVYAHVLTGGASVIYKSTNRADSWSRLAELPEVEPRFDINLSNPQLWYYGLGLRLFRSENEGQTWMPTAFPIRAVGQGLQNGLSALRSHPGNASIVLLATNGPHFGGPDGNGLFFSSNRGGSWERKNDNGGQNIIIEPGSPAIFVTRVEGGAIFASFDSGATFQAPFHWITASSVPATVLVDPRNSAVYHAPGARSDNRGQSWTELSSTVVPLLGLVSDELRVSGSRNSTIPIVHSVSVETLGSSLWAIPFTVEMPTEPWLTVTPLEGATPERLTMRIHPGGLNLGEHQATIRAHSTQSANQTVELDLTLTVTDAPAASPSPLITTYAGNGSSTRTGDGIPAVEASVFGVYGLDFAASTGLVLAENFHDQVTRVAADGIIHLVAGTGEGGYSGDGVPAVGSQLDSPYDVAVAPDGSIYIAERFGYRLRKVEPEGVISTVAGDGEFGFTSEPSGRAVDLSISPQAVAVDKQGNVYVAALSRIFRIAPNGTYTRFANRGADGLAFGPDGSLYAASTSTGRVDIVNGDASTAFAGSGEPGYSGDGGAATAARLNGPRDVAVDAEGRVFIADEDNHVVRLVELDGTIRTYAGNGVEGTAGDGGPANAAELDSPKAVAVGDDGALFIADDSRRVRKVLAPGSTRPEISQAGLVNAASYSRGAVAPNQIVSIFGLNLAPDLAIAQTSPLPTTLAGVTIELTDSAGQKRTLGLFSVAPGQINCLIAAEAAGGAGRLRITSSGESAEIPIIVEATAPGLFSANASGQGVAAAAAVRIDSAGAQTPVEVVDFSARPFHGLPIELGAESDQVVLLLYGTGFRHHIGAIEASIGGAPAQVLGIAAQPQFAGLDQMNVIIPRSLLGAGEVEVVVKLGGTTLNTVTVTIR